VHAITNALSHAVPGRDRSIDPIDEVTTLVEQSLLQKEEVGREPRFRMLETILVCGLAALQSSDEEANVRARHTAYFLRLVKDAVGQYTSEDLGSPVPITRANSVL
jgi:hypothetical protein